MTQPTLDDSMKVRMQALRASAQDRAPTRKIAVFSTPRSGSSFFCDTLASTGQFGNPLEWLNARWLETFRKSFGLERVEIPRYLDWISRRSTSDNGVFSINIQVHQYAKIKDNGFDALAFGFDTLIYVHRADKLAQSLSYAKALVTDQWSSDLRPRIKDFDVGQITDFTILEQLAKISRWDHYYFRRLKPHMHREYLYEDFAATPESFATVREELGVQPPSPGLESGFRVQRDSRDLARLEKLRAYISGENAGKAGRQASVPG